MSRKGQFFISLIVVTSVISCAPMVKKPPEKIVELPEKRFGRNYFRKAREHEDKGDLVVALKHYKLAITVDPQNHEALEGKKRLEISLRNLAEGHYEEGLKFHREGKYGLARHQFLIALRLWPDYPEVIKMLTSRKRIQIKRYIVHTIKAGESLSKVAKIYYGDFRKFPIIAKYNNLTDATRIKAGQKIKIPEIEGTDFLVGKKALKTDEIEVADSGFWNWEKYALKKQEPGKEPELKAKQKEEEPVDHVALYRDHGVDLFKEKKYEEAIVEFKKVLDVHSIDRVALEYSYKSHFHQGVALFEKKDYLAAKDQFETCLRYKTDCKKCHMYIKKGENFYKEMHYKKGIQLFHKELLIEAIQEWELVKIIDPNYKRVDYLVGKTKNILKKLEELNVNKKRKL